MNMTDWEEMIADLIHMDLELDEPPEYFNLSQNAVRHAGHWGSCSIAQKALRISPNWENLTEEDRYFVMRTYPKLYKLGMRFTEDIRHGNYKDALAVHRTIQSSKINEDSFQRKVNRRL